MAKKDKGASVSVVDALDSELNKLGLGNLVKLAEEVVDREVMCYSTGLPQLDYALHPEKMGLPVGRDIEVFSKRGSAGKTSLAVTVMAAWQAIGKATAFIDHENTMTEQYLNLNGVITRPELAPEGVIPMRWVKHPPNGPPHSAETIFDVLRKLSGVMDLIVLDSVASMEKQQNLDKDANDPNQMCGIAKNISEFCRRNVSKKATIIWINQTRQSVGGFNPTGATQYVTTGGRALDFYTSCKISLVQTDKIKAGANTEEFIGMKIQALLEKNKIAAPWRKVNLTYMFGRGFSSHYDYFDMALKLGVVEKKGGWFLFNGKNIQGQVNFINMLYENPDMFSALKLAVEGEPATEADLELLDAPVEEKKPEDHDVEEAA